MSNNILNDETNNFNENTIENNLEQSHDVDRSPLSPPTIERTDDTTTQRLSLLPQIRLKTNNCTSPVRKLTESSEITTIEQNSPYIQQVTSPILRSTKNGPNTETKFTALHYIRRCIVGIASHLSCDFKRSNYPENTKSDGTKYPVLWYCEQDTKHMLQYTADQILTGTSFVAYSLNTSMEIEQAYQQYQRRQGPETFSLSAYQFNFEHMFRMNTRTNYKRKIRRNTEQQILHPKWAEYEKIESYFLHSVASRKSISIVKIERINNPTLLDMYEAKLKSMTRRYSENPNYCINNNKRTSYKENVDNTSNNFERRWLFHGTKKEVVPKIVKQGFNRSFANQRVSYGKGVYFARDAHYSCNTKFAAKDEDGIQYVFLCRVAVGDWCLGTRNQVIPASKPYDDRDTFDSTVDNSFDPGIFVIYHDCQAYPEYLISFREN